MMREKKIIRYALVAALAFGFGMRVWNLAGPDMAVDDALYSLRSIGYVDYVAATNRQTTPVIWFSELQWWQRLSFHDGPPLGFLVQWLSFQIGGDNLLAARLPFVAAGVASIAAVFLLGRLIGGAWVGIASVGAMAVMNYAVWFSRIGNLDGFLVPWITLSIYFFLKAKERPANYVWWGACVGAGLATKYTFLFLGPPFAVMLAVWHRGAFRQRWFWAGCAVLLLLVSPIIVYNVMMWQARGHPDAALS
ncbi:MAG: glycosyltransferase family 39 protein, partial [bacterium]|nr:glycosyltransferase family 39 protein [bacterium]